MIEVAWANPLLAFAISILLSFTVRKVFARVQSRRGPLLWLPGRWQDINRSKILQPLYDIEKLFSKQTLIPQTATPFFVIGPVLGLLFAILLTLFVPLANQALDYQFSLVVIFYLLIGVTMCIIVGGTASASLFAAIGGVREVDLMLTNEIPFILGTFSLAIWHYTLSVKEMMGLNLVLNPFAAAAVYIAILVKLHIKPFDISEADSEIVGGLTTEYSGKLLGVLEVTKVLMLFALAAIFVDLFLWIPVQGALSWVVFLAEVLIVSACFGVTHALFARFRIDQASRWLLTVSTALSIVALGWAVVWRFVL